jgi:acetyl-CoA synthetase
MTSLLPLSDTEHHAPIRRMPRAVPLIGHYNTACSHFSWDQSRDWAQRLPDGGWNMAHEAVDRHGRGVHRAFVALRCIAADDTVTEYTYGDLAERTSRFASALTAMGVRRGEAVATLLDRGIDLHTTALGAIKAGAVYCPLFPAFGPEPVRERLSLGSVRVLVTTALAYRRKVEALRSELPSLTYVLVVGPGPYPDGTLSFDEVLASGDPEFPAASMRADDPALLHFTSGTTGKPKGAIHVHEAVVAHHATSVFSLDLRSGTTFWCTADPGWVTGTSYGIIGPLTCAATVIMDAGDFSAERWYRILAEQHVEVFYTAPTAIRMLMRAPEDLASRFDLTTLRHIVSVGEPLNAEAVIWGDRTFGMPIHDTWWQTETGAIMISNFSGCDVLPGSMGRSMPGIEATIVRQDAEGHALVVDGKVQIVEDPTESGIIALRAGWPSMFRGYLNDPERYAKCFADGWYLSGDLARRDADGYFWFVGRADDVIKSAGHLVGPFEVESALMAHPAVIEAGVIGKPDPVAGEIVKAFVSLREGFEPDEQMRAELIAFGRRRLGSVAPREIAFEQNLPHTRSGKVMRRLLKARELGLPTGDLSTMEQH